MHAYIRAKYLIIVVLLMSFVSPHNKKIRVYLIGDSTMCPYEPSRAPLTGWGMPFSYFFDSTVEVINKAKGGRSTRTFIGENRWQPIADSLQEGDYVLIQFGHNDEAKEEKYKDRYTSIPDYKKNLTMFIEQARAKKAIPVLITPVSRMKFDSAGNAKETHIEYTAAVYEVAKERQVAVIDLDGKSRELLQQLGPKFAKYLYMQLDPMEHPNWPEGQKDNTHFTEFGARKLAEIVLAGIRGLNLELADHIVKPQMKK